MPAGLVKVKTHKGVYYRESAKNRHRGKPDRCFYVTYRNAAKKFVREKVGWTSEGYSAQLADQVRSERIRTMRHGKELPDRKKTAITFGEAWKKYDAWLDTGKKHTRQDRARYENHIKRHLKNKPLSEIRPLDLEKLRDRLTKKGLAPATVKHVLVIIRQVINKAIAWGLWNGTNPIKKVKLPKLNNKKERFFTHQEADQLLIELKKRSKQLHLIALTSLHTGMRAGEIFGIRWGDLDFENMTINVIDTDKGDTRKAFMTKTLKANLETLKEGTPSEFIFKARGGGKIQGVSKSYYESVKELGFNDGVTDRLQRAGFHTLRHTYASWLAMQGTPILEIKELLGHATLAMTERYAHLIPDTKRRTVARFEEAIRDADSQSQGNQSSEPDKPGTTP